MSKPNILIVDDRPANLLALDAALSDVEATVITAESGNEALGLLLEHKFALVLLDVQMPGMDGFEVAELMRVNPETSSIPIIFVTAISKEDQYIFKGYESGAVDYLFKPINDVILLSKVNIFLGIWNSAEALRAAQKEIEQQRDELKELAIRDHLTGLFQRRVFDEMLAKHSAKAKRDERCIAVAMIDCDHFKQVNDSYGHAVGDDVLKNVADQLTLSTRESDVVCRYGGEEFVILMPDTRISDGIVVCERIRVAIENCKVAINGNDSISITVSIGIAECHHGQYVDAAELVKNADKQLYLAKDFGRNRVSPASVQHDELEIRSGR